MLFSISLSTVPSFAFQIPSCFIAPDGANFQLRCLQPEVNLDLIDHGHLQMRETGIRSGTCLHITVQCYSVLCSSRGGLHVANYFRLLSLVNDIGVTAIGCLIFLFTRIDSEALFAPLTEMAYRHLQQQPLHLPRSISW